MRWSNKYLKWVFFLSILFFSSNGIYAQKIDTIIHVNGNILTGDLKKISDGVTTWKMEGMGTIILEQVKINTIRSKKKFEIKMKNGVMYYGSFDTSKFFRKVYVIAEKDKFLIDVDNIVEVYPLKNSFWLRTSGNFSLGGNYTKATEITTISFSGKINYRKMKSSFELSANKNNTYQGDTVSSSKTDMLIDWQRSLSRGWSTGFSVGASQNSELGNKLRLDFNAIGIKDISYNIWNRLYAGAGLSVAQEQSYSGTPDKTDLAGIVQVVWKVYKYTSPKIWVDAGVSYIPYLTESNRYRTAINLNPQFSVISDDLKVGINFYHNYDSKPPSGATSKSDYAINLELTYSFH